MILVYGLSNSAILMTLSVLEGHFLLQAFSSAIFRIYNASRGPSASAELLVLLYAGQLRFLLRDAMLARYYADVVCPSVRFGCSIPAAE